MPVIYETRWFRRCWSWVRREEESTGAAYWATFEPSFSQIDEAMNSILSELTSEDWEIKSVMPLTAARTFVEGLRNNAGLLNSTWGGGYGFGAAFTCGVVILCQRRLDLTEEELNRYRAVQAEQAAEAHAAGLKAERQARMERGELGPTGAERIRQMPIEEIGGLWSRRQRYGFAGTVYDTQAEAIAAREEMARKAEQDEQGG